MKIVVGMSGGIDSTYAALKLIDEGHEVVGAVLKMHQYTEISAAEESCRALGIPLYVKNVESKFLDTVVPNFMSEYKNGRTPNPCIICNSEVKFRSLLELADELGFDMIATGHYARIVEVDWGGKTKRALARAFDTKKDQSYMLWRLDDDVISRLLLPLGELTKEEIRADARERGIAAADRSDSQEICFIPDGDYPSYIEDRLGKCPEGDFVDRDGNVIARHKGIIRYTVGQRKGLGVAAGARIFVTDINPATNRITLAYEMPSYRRVKVSGVKYGAIPPLAIGEQVRAEVKLRYQAPHRECTVRAIDGGGVEVLLDSDTTAIANGQSAVFYINGTLALGGFIDGSSHSGMQI